MFTNFISSDSESVLAVTIGADGVPLQVETTFQMDVLEMDMAEVDPEAAGMLANLSFMMSQTIVYSQINQVEQPVAEPNLGTVPPGMSDATDSTTP